LSRCCCCCWGWSCGCGCVVRWCEWWSGRQVTSRWAWLRAANDMRVRGWTTAAWWPCSRWVVALQHQPPASYSPWSKQLLPSMPTFISAISFMSVDRFWHFEPLLQLEMISAHIWNEIHWPHRNCVSPLPDKNCAVSAFHRHFKIKDREFQQASRIEQSHIRSLWVHMACPLH